VLIQKFKHQVESFYIEDPSELAGLTEAQAEIGKKPPEAAGAKYSVEHVKEFVTLWLRYVITFSTHYIIKTSYEKSQIASLIDVRPSIINSRRFDEVVQAILNPRLKSKELMKKFQNMHRILDNVCTYYFETFLSMHEREIIAGDIGYIMEKVTFLL